jgi:hypothetical protein
MFSEARLTDGVVDGVRYILERKEEDIKYYTLYFMDDTKTTMQVEKTGDSSWIMETNSGTIEVSGKKNDFTLVYPEGDNGERLTQKVVREIIFGKDPILKPLEALITAVLAAAGGVIIYKAEEIFIFLEGKKLKRDPKWNDFTKYKAIGGVLITIAAVLLILFVFVI